MNKAFTIVFTLMTTALASVLFLIVSSRNNPKVGTSRVSTENPVIVAATPAIVNSGPFLFTATRLLSPRLLRTMKKPYASAI